MSDPPNCPSCGTPLTPAATPYCPTCTLTTCLPPSPPTSPPLPDSLGGHAIIAEIGRGGMGVIYRAHHRSLDRHVALKVLVGAPFAGPATLARFHREATAAAALQHPNIVPVYDVGETDGIPWLAMAIIDGGDLSQSVAAGPLLPHTAARITRDLANALAHAHAAGVIHRDLKPSNILLAADATPYIADFGIASLARDLTPGTSPTLTLPGTALGSPGFSAPEQLAPTTTQPPAAAADIYSLGAVLYFLLTGRPPHQAASVPQLITSVLDDEPVHPSQLVRAIPPQLAAVCLKCLRKNPADRYPAARDLASDLERFLDGLPVHARPAPLHLRLTALWKRHPLPLAATAATLIALAATTATALWAARHQTRLEHRTALLADARTTRLAATADHRTRSLDALREAWSIRPSTEIRDEAIAALSLPQLTDLGPAPAPPPQNIDPLTATDPTGTRTATATPGGSTLRILPTSGGPPLATCPHPAPLTSVAWAGDLIATGCSDRLIYIWDPGGHLLHRLAGHEGDHISVHFTGRAQLLVSIANDKWLRLWHAARGVEVARLVTTTDHALPLTLSPDGTLTATTSTGTGRAYRISPSPCLAALAPPGDELHPENLRSLSLHPDGRLAACVDENLCRVWDFATGTTLTTIQKQPGEWLHARFSPTGDTLWTCGWSTGLVSLPVPALAPPSPPRFGAGFLLHALGTGGGSAVLVNSSEKYPAVAVVGLNTPGRTSVRTPDTLVAALTNDSAFLVTTSYAKPAASVWSLPSGSHHLDIPTTALVTSVLPSPAGDRLLLVTEDGALPVSLPSWQAGPVLRPGTHLKSPVWDPAGRFVAASIGDQVQLLDPRTLAPLTTLHLPAHAGWPGLVQLATDANGQHLIAHLAVGTVLRWDLDALATALEDLDIPPPWQSATPAP